MTTGFLELFERAKSPNVLGCIGTIEFLTIKTWVREWFRGLLYE